MVILIFNQNTLLSLNDMQCPTVVLINSSPDSIINRQFNHVEAIFMKTNYLFTVVLILTAYANLAESIEASLKPARIDLMQPMVVNNETKARGSIVADTYGFETSEGFSQGFLGGQAGWTVLATGSTTQPIIANSDPSTGTQHMQLAQDTSLSVGTLIGGLSPDLGAQPAGNESRVSVDIKITAVLGASYTVFAQAPSVGQGTWNVNFDPQGTIYVADNTGSGYVFIDSGLAWPVNTYFNLEVITNPGGLPGIEYFLNGTLFYTQTTMLLTDKVEQMALYSDNNNAGEVANFDNLIIDNNYGSGGPTGPVRSVPGLGGFGLVLLLMGLLWTVRRKFVE